MSIDMDEFVSTYNVVYHALYEGDRHGLVEYGNAVEAAEWMVRNNAQYKRLVKAFYERTFDVPTSDRELAAFVITSRMLHSDERRSA